MEPETPSPRVTLEEVDASNWRAVAAVHPRPEQQGFVLATTHYLAMSAYGGVWRSLAIVADGVVVGHAMWGVDPDDGSHWIGGLVVDAGSQGRGIGRAAVLALVERFRGEPDFREARLSYEPENAVAAKLYRDLGFEETGEMEGDEVVARLPG